jgi:Transcriptional regulator PadR-like family
MRSSQSAWDVAEAAGVLLVSSVDRPWPYGWNPAAQGGACVTRFSRWRTPGAPRAKHGYAIMTDVAAFSGVRMEPGTLYGALSRLERRGWVRPLATEERRRPYEITAAGQEILAEQVTTMQQIVRIARQRTATAFGT